MTILSSQIDTRSDTFKRNAETMRGLVEDLRRRTNEIRLEKEIRFAQRVQVALLPTELRRETEPLDFARELDDLILFAERRQFGPSTASIIRLAELPGVIFFSASESFSTSLVKSCFTWNRWSNASTAASP